METIITENGIGKWKTFGNFLSENNCSEEEAKLLFKYLLFLKHTDYLEMLIKFNRL